jgi:hypothetical protein
MAADLGALFGSMVSAMGGGAEAVMAAAKAFNNIGIGVVPTSEADSDVGV